MKNSANVLQPPDPEASVNVPSLITTSFSTCVIFFCASLQDVSYMLPTLNTSISTALPLKESGRTPSPDLENDLPLVHTCEHFGGKKQATKRRMVSTDMNSYLESVLFVWLCPSVHPKAKDRTRRHTVDAPSSILLSWKSRKEGRGGGRRKEG